VSETETESVRESVREIYRVSVCERERIRVRERQMRVCEREREREEIVPIIFGGFNELII